MHEEVMAAFATHLGATRSPTTTHAYLGQITRLRRRHPDLLAVTLTDLERHLADRRTTHAPESRKAFRTAVRAFYRWTEKTGLTPDNPAAELEPIPVPFRLARIANDDALESALIRASARDKALILLGRLAGLRLTEMTTLRLDHRHGRRLHIRGKGEKERMVPVHDELGWALSNLERANLEREAPSAYYFPGAHGAPHMHPQSVNKAITRATGCNPHALRHAAATAFFESVGRDIEATARYLGHSSVETTRRYLHLGFDRLEEGVGGMGLRPSLRALR